MNKIDELIEKLCPNGVEYRRLEELCGTITTGKLNANAMVTNGEYPFFTCDANPFKIDKYAFDEEAILISGNGSQVGHINYYNGKFNAYQRTYVLYDVKLVNIKFLFHYLKGYLKDYIMIHSRKGSVPYITLPILQNFSVAVPPLEIQNEIVYILDKFTALLAELKAELKARKKQYAYYRDKLFEFEEKINYLPLKELCKSIKDGMHNLPQNTLGKGKYPILSVQNIFASKIDYNGKRYVDEETYLSENKRSNIEKGDVLLTIVATIGRTAVVEENNKFLLQRSVCILKPNELINSYYLKYYLDTCKIQDYMIANAHGAAQAGLYLKQVAEILVPVPPLDEQQRIANILDRFDKLCNSLTEGIPAEIEARQKQYEYYRDKLLTFKELVIDE